MVVFKNIYNLIYIFVLYLITIRRRKKNQLNKILSELSLDFLSIV